MALTIAGVEVTQGIQYFQSPFAECGPQNARVPCADNSLPLVEGKTTIVRVFVAGGVTGSGHSLNCLATFPSGGRWLIATLPVMPPTPFDRARADHSLNLILPVDRAKGVVTMTIAVWDSIPGGGGDQTTVTINFQPSALVPIRLVRIRYRGRNLNLQAPSMGDVFSMAERLLARTFPVPFPGVSIIRDSVEDYDGDFSSTFPGVTSPGLVGTTGTVWQIIDRLIAVDGLAANVIYGAIVPGGSLPTGPQFSATVFPAMSLDRRFFAVLPAFEMLAVVVARILWQTISPCLVPSQADKVYSPPLRPGLTFGSIGEVGMNGIQTVEPSAQDLLSPQRAGAVWISPFTYKGLVRRLICPLPTLTAVDSPAPFSRPTRPVLDITFARRQFDRYSVVDLPTWILPRPLPPLNEAGPWFAELRAADGTVLVRQGIDGWPAGVGEGDQARVRTSLPWIDSARTLTLTEGDKVRLTHQIERSAPRLTVSFAPPRSSSGHPLTLRWRADRVKGRQISVVVRASGDGGRTWTGIPVRSRGNRLTIDQDGLPAGHECLLEVHASGGMRTSVYRSKPFPLSRPMPTPSIIWPSRAVRVKLGAELELFGIPAIGLNGSDELTWSSSLDGKLGAGPRLVVRDLSVGTHTIELRGNAFPDRVSRITVTVVAGGVRPGRARRPR